MNLIKARNQRLDRIARKLGFEKEKVDMNAWLDNALTDIEVTKWNLQQATKTI